MFIGRVVGTVWATKKVDNVKSLRFLMIHPVNIDKAPNTNVVVAADTLGAGIGELVICSYGHAARRAITDQPNELSIEAAVIGIVDEIEVDERLLNGLAVEKLQQDYPTDKKTK
jgi:ethanolamine utilization protein EutN